MCPEDAVRDRSPPCSGGVFVRGPEGPAGRPGLTLPGDCLLSLLLVFLPVAGDLPR